MMTFDTTLCRFTAGGLSEPGELSRGFNDWRGGMAPFLCYVPSYVRRIGSALCWSMPKQAIAAWHARLPVFDLGMDFLVAHRDGQYLHNNMTLESSSSRYEIVTRSGGGLDVIVSGVGRQGVFLPMDRPMILVPRRSARCVYF